MQCFGNCVRKISDGWIQDLGGEAHSNQGLPEKIDNCGYRGDSRALTISNQAYIQSSFSTFEVHVFDKSRITDPDFHRKNHDMDYDCNQSVMGFASVAAPTRSCHLFSSVLEFSYITAPVITATVDNLMKLKT